jgi:hypothetical protein
VCQVDADGVPDGPASGEHENTQKVLKRGNADRSLDGMTIPHFLPTDVTLTPDTSSLPGGQVLQHLMNGLGGWALALSLAGLLIGAAAWALGSHGQNYQQSFVGRRAVLISGLAALLIGAGPAIVNFFFNAGQGVH